MNGFTLLELLVTIIIAGILFGIGIPAMGDFIRNSRMTATANDLVAAMHFARSEAIKRRSPVVVCASANPLDDAGADCTDTRILNAATGWIVFWDADVSGRRDAGELLLQQHAGIPAGITGRSSVTPFRITYLDTGFSGTFTDIDGDGKRDPADELDLNGDGWDRDDPAENPDDDNFQDSAEPIVPTAAFNVVFCDQRGNVPSAGELSAARGLFIGATGRPGVTRGIAEVATLLGNNPGGASAGCT